MTTSSAIFLDRDGTINISHHQYICDINKFLFIDNAIEAMIEFKKMGFILIIVTNQSGIARGFFTEKQFIHLTKWMLFYLKTCNVFVDAVYCCPHHIQGVIKQFQRICFCRKPNPGMLLDAQYRFNINMTTSYMVGDTESDMLAGKLANVGTTVLICNNQKMIKKSISIADWMIKSLEYLPKKIRKFQLCK